MDWVDPLLRGVMALIITTLLFVAARWRYKVKGEQGDAPADIGLD